MTLLLGIFTPSGFWQSSDFRLTLADSGKLVDDWSPKQTSVLCSDGSAHITYMGIGRLPVGTREYDISEWVADALHGQMRSVHASIEAIRREATNLFGKQRVLKHHLFLVGAFVGGTAWIAEIRNFRHATDWCRCTPETEFIVAAKRVEEPLSVCAGAWEAVAVKDRSLLRTKSKVRPRRAEDYLQLLAHINKRAAAHPELGRLISKACFVQWMPSSGEGAKATLFDWGAMVPAKAWARPTVVMGINVTEGILEVTQMLESLEHTAGQTGQDPAAPKIDSRGIPIRQRRNR